MILSPSKHTPGLQINNKKPPYMAFHSQELNAIGQNTICPDSLYRLLLGFEKFTHFSNTLLWFDWLHYKE